MELTKNNFNLKKAAIYKAIKLEKNPIFGKADIFKRISFFLFILTFLVFILSGSSGFEIGYSDTFLLGLMFLFFSSLLFFWQIKLFFKNKIKFPRIKQDISLVLDNQDNINLAGFLELEVARAVYKALRKAGRGSLKTSDFIYFLLKDNKELNFIFTRLELNINEVKSLLKLFNLDDNSGGKYSSDFAAIIEDSINEAINRGAKRVGVRDVIVSLSDHCTVMREIFKDKNIEKEDLRSLTIWLYGIKDKVEYDSKFWKWKNLVKRGSLAKDWASGYSLMLDRFSTDWTKIFKRQGFPEIIGHSEEIKIMERELSREEFNNVLLIGEGGTGRKSMIFELARKSFFGESLSRINYKRIVEIELPSLLAVVESDKEAETVLDSIFEEVVSSGNIILVISDIHNFIGGDSKLGRIDISGLLGSYLSSANFQIVGITDPAGYRNSIENSSLSILFEKVEVLEISNEDTLRILKRMTLGLENKYNIIISYLALKTIVDYCSKYMPSKPFPKKAMDLLGEAVIYLSQKKEKVLLPKHIAWIVSQKTNIPVGEMKEKEKEILMNLEDLIHQKIINQEEAVNEIASGLRRSRAEISGRKRPMGSFLFLGPTGVGKTETAKALSEVYFGSAKKMIRIDMSEFQSLSDISRLIGSLEYEGILTTKIKEDPFALILLDEIEKAHPDILNIFLQILDEGHVTDGLGRRVDFKSSIIIATSNAGSNMILDNIKANRDWNELKEDLLDYLFKEGMFRPEFINRFDAVVLFKSLTKGNLLDIVQLLLKDICKNLEEKNIEFIITQELKEKIVELGYNPSFGAREIKRVIQGKVENQLASAIISGELKKGSRVIIDPVDFKIEIQ